MSISHRVAAPVRFFYVRRSTKLRWIEVAEFNTSLTLREPRWRYSNQAMLIIEIWLIEILAICMFKAYGILLNIAWFSLWHLTRKRVSRVSYQRLVARGAGCECLSPKCAKYEAAHQTSHLCSIGSGRLSVPIQQAEQPIAHASRYTWRPATMHARARERARERNSLTKKDKIYFDWFCYIEFSSAVRKYLECVLIDHHAAYE